MGKTPVTCELASLAVLREPLSLGVTQRLLVELLGREKFTLLTFFCPVVLFDLLRIRPETISVLRL